ncbi:MAG: protease inhibitor I42 family protein [Acetobacteraceae bacterium]
MIVVDQSASGQTLDLPVGQVIELRLAENPTTGFRWTVVANGAPACVVLSDRFESPSGPPGKGGEHLWEIKGVRIGECDIALQYRRSFEPDAPGGAFALHVRVTQ